MAEFKDMLKYFRERENLSQKDLAEKLDISASTISMYEVGSRQPNFKIEEQIADFFGIDLNTLRGKTIPDEASYNYMKIMKNLKLCEKYNNAIPEIQAAVDRLLDI